MFSARFVDLVAVPAAFILAIITLALGPNAKAASPAAPSQNDVQRAFIAERQQERIVASALHKALRGFIFVTYPDVSNTQCQIIITRPFSLVAKQFHRSWYVLDLEANCANSLNQTPPEVVWFVCEQTDTMSCHVTIEPTELLQEKGVRP